MVPDAGSHDDKVTEVERQQDREGNVESLKTGTGVKLNEQASLGSKEVQYVRACERTSAVEISESRDQKILAIKMSVAVNQWGRGSDTEKATDLDLA